MNRQHNIVFFGFNPINTVTAPFRYVKRKFPTLERFSNKQIVGTGLAIGGIGGLAIHKMGNYNTQQALQATKNLYGIKDEPPQ